MWGRMKPKKLLLIVLVVGTAIPVLFFFLHDSPGTHKLRARKLIVKNICEDNRQRQALTVLNHMNSTATQGKNTNNKHLMLQTERRYNLNAGCLRLRKKGLVSSFVDPINLNHIVVNDKYKVMYCYIPKVACTNMKRIFLLLTGRMNTTNPLDLKANAVHFKYDSYLTYLNEYKPDEVEEKIKTYKKIIFLREPLERLLSAYRNKFTDPKSEYFHKRFGRKIIRRYRKNANNDALQKGNDVSFVEFVKYLTDPVTMNAEGYNEHWALYSSLCHPCTIKYNIIAKYQTIDDDVDHILSELNLKDTIKFPPRNATYKRKKTEDMLTDYYKTVPSDLLQKLWRVFSVDYRLFDYPYPEVLKGLIKP